MKRSAFQVMSRLIGLVKPLSGHMLLAIIMGIIGHLFASFITIFGVFMILNVLNLISFMSLKTMFLLVIIFAVLRGVFRYLEQAMNHFIAFKLLALIRDKVFEVLRKLAPAKLESRNSGDLISIISSDIELLEVFYAHTISPVAIAFVFSVLMSVFIGKFSIVLGLVAFFSYAFIGIALPFFTSKISKDYGIKFRNQAGEMSGFMLDSIRGLNEIIQFNEGENRLRKINERTDRLSMTEKKLKSTLGINISLTNSVVLIFDVLIVLLSMYLYSLGKISFAEALISSVALISSFGPVLAVSNLGIGLQNTLASGNRVLDVLDEKPVVEELEGYEEIGFSGAEACDISFSYENEEVLKDFSIEFPQNKIIGIVGKSGSGKSTLLKLFMRFWETDKGRLEISKRNINEINTSNLRDMESFMTQDSHLFHDSIRNNISIARLDASDEEIEQACKKASIHDFIMSLENGYDTPVAELGESLSGGERQRIGLARAFLHDAPFMLLDEPTSNLDSLNEATILKALSEEAKGRTIALVSHRKSTMRIADKVYTVENGRKS